MDIEWEKYWQGFQDAADLIELHPERAVEIAKMIRDVRTRQIYCLLVENDIEITEGDIWPPYFIPVL